MFGNNITIEHSGNNFPLFGQNFRVDINNSVRNSLKPNERLTTERALSILKKIRINSSVKSFITKSVVALIGSGALIAAGFIASAVAVTSIALGVFGLMATLAGATCFVFALKLTFSGQMSSLSRSYAEEADMARQYVERILAAQRNGDQVQVRLAP